MQGFAWDKAESFRLPQKNVVISHYTFLKQKAGTWKLPPSRKHRPKIHHTLEGFMMNFGGMFPWSSVKTMWVAKLSFQKKRENKKTKEDFPKKVYKTNTLPNIPLKKGLCWSRLVYFHFSLVPNITLPSDNFMFKKKHIIQRVRFPNPKQLYWGGKPGFTKSIN